MAARLNSAGSGSIVIFSWVCWTPLITVPDRTGLVKTGATMRQNINGRFRLKASPSAL
jgi:hypothetical protein